MKTRAEYETQRGMGLSQARSFAHQWQPLHPQMARLIDALCDEVEDYRERAEALGE